MRRLGFEAEPIAAEVEALEMDDWRAKTGLGRQARATRRIRARAPHDSRDLLRALEEEQPDALLVDVLARVPSARLPGVDPGPATGPLPLPRPRIGLELLGIAKPLSTVPLHVYMSAEPFERSPRSRAGSIVMVGPCSWEPGGEVPRELAGIEGPFVLVTTSSEFQDDGRLVQMALAALADESVHVVATMPSRSIAELEVPPNATVAPFTPHAPILRRAVCAITHGGMGVTQKALGIGSAGLRGALRSRPVRGCAPRRGERCRHSASRLAPAPRSSAPQGSRGNRVSPGGRAVGARLRCSRRSESRRRCL